jgi:hypothetical protein
MSKSRPPIPRLTPEEVSAYAASIGFRLDGEYFIDYWESRGWKIKPGVLMVSWQATVRNWKRMDAERKGLAASSATPPPPAKPKVDPRRQADLQLYADGIIAMESWLRCEPASRPAFVPSDPQEEIARITAKCRDHYGHTGARDMWELVKKLRPKS